MWLAKTLCATVEILPRIYQPEKIKSADYLINGQKWDLKEITSNRNNAIYTRIRHKKEQADNFIFDIGKSKLTIKDAVKQVNELSKDFNWIKIIICKKQNQFEIIEKQKKS